MATVSELVVLVTANTAQFQRGMTQAEATTSKFATAAKVGFAIAAVAAVKFVADSVEAYNEHQEALLQLQTTIDNSPALIGASTAAFEKQATALQNLTGFQDEEILKADAVLGRFGLTADQLKAINPLVLDYARATGTDASSAASLLGKALLGNARALKTVGISFTATGDRAKDFATIQASLESKVGGLAQAYGETLPGKLAIAAAEFDDVKEKVGQALIPVLKQLADVLVNLIPLFEKVASAMKFLPLLQMSEDFNSSQDAVHKFGNALLDTIPILGHYVELNENVTDSLGHSVAGMAKATGVTDKLLAASQDLGGQQDKLGEAIDGVTADMQAQREAARQLAGGMLGLVSSAQDLAEKQNIVNKMQEQGHDSGKKYNDAVLELLVSQEDFNGQLRDYKTQLEAAGLSTEDAEGKVIKLGRSLGISKQDVLNILDPLDRYKEKLGAIPSQVTTHITSVFDQVGNINPGGPHPRFASGGIVTRPTVGLIGEAGPEAIIPLNQANMLGGVTVNVSGWVGNDQQIAKKVRDELVKLGKRNVTTGI